MCRYCKKLNQIKGLREKELLDCIQSWRNRDKIARSLVLRALDLIGYKDCEKGLRVDLLNSKKTILWSEILFVKSALDFLNQDYLGK